MKSYIPLIELKFPADGPRSGGVEGTPCYAPGKENTPCVHNNYALCLRMIPKHLNTTVVPKGWGEELHVINNDRYCLKLLRFAAGGQSSMHYHQQKHETWFVLKGVFQLAWIDQTEGHTLHVSRQQGDVIDLPPFTMHQVTATTDTEIVEVSTYDNPEDNYRVAPGDSQK